MGDCVAFMFIMTLHCLLLRCNCSLKWVFQSKYKPYGPKMCRELCEDPQGSYLYLIEDLSCHRIQVHISTSNESRFQEDLSRLTDTVNTVAVRTGWDICRKEYQEKDTFESGSSVVQIKRDVILHKACKEDEVAVVKFILYNGIADIESQNTKRLTPTMIAAFHGQLEVFNFLVSQGSNLSVVDNKSYNLLHLAIIGGNIDIGRQLIENYSVDIDRRGYRQQTPLLVAARHGNVGMFVILVNKGCNLTAVDDYNNNVLHCACMNGHADIVQYILRKNLIDIESKGYIQQTSALLAAQYGHREVLELLVENRCNLRAVDIYDNNIIHLACKYGETDSVKYLLKQEAVKGMKKVKDRSFQTYIAEMYKDNKELLHYCMQS